MIFINFNSIALRIPPGRDQSIEGLAYGVFCNVGLVGLVGLFGLVGLVGLFGLFGLFGLVLQIETRKIIMKTLPRGSRFHTFWLRFGRFSDLRGHFF